MIAFEAQTPDNSPKENPSNCHNRATTVSR